ncbi:MAG TPA: hypothetical protein VGM24_07170 [Puia sp.]
MNVFFLAILLYLLYRFIVGLVIPIFRTTRHVRQQFQQMNGQGPGQAPGQPDAGGPQTRTKTRDAAHPDTSKVGEYIDFEEVK